MSFFDALPQRYRVILCDLWGVVHDGLALYPGAAERLIEWRGDGRFVLLITNAPRTAEAIAAHVRRLGLPKEGWDAIATAGEAGIEALNRLDAPVGFIGTGGDRAVLEGKGVRIADGDDFTDLACTGLEEHRPEVAQYRAELERLSARGVRLHCLNPDRVVIQGGVPVPCAGAIADLYEALGGAVSWYGKPYRPIYEHALKLAGNPPREQVLAVGDGLETDMLGAARMGFDGVFVRSGISAGTPFPDDFGARNGVGDWRPVAVVDSLR